MEAIMAPPKQPKTDLAAKMRAKMAETTAPAAHAPLAEPTKGKAPKRRGKTALVGAQFDSEVLKQVRQIAADTDRDVREVVAEALNLLFKLHDKPQIAK
jgi:hypothetical protein